jgi:hypothetical protein
VPLPDLPIPFLIPIGAVLAACITGTVTFVTLVISKEQKISEFRQAWIDAFRDELSEFAGHARRIAHERVPVNIYRTTKPMLERIAEEDEDAKRPDLFHENRQRMAQSYYALRLRLNPGESDHVALLERLDRVYKTLNLVSGATRREDCINELDGLASVAQSVLKREWTRVKEGEPRFSRVTSLAKWVAIGLAVALGALIAYALWTRSVA